MPRIAVIGAGVVGLSSALRIRELLPQAEVTVFADKFPPFTTSDVSGGFWEPHLLFDTPKESERKWSGKTMDHIKHLANTDSARYTGACYVSGYQCNADPNAELPFWRDQVSNFRLLTEDELKQFPGMKFGFFFTTVMVEPQLYLQWLMKRFQRFGGRMKNRFLKNIEELAAEGYDAIVNCTGVGARDLVKDPDVKPVRGQIIRVKAPWLKHFLVCVGEDRLAYMIPSSSFVVMGGTEIIGDWDTAVNQTDKTRIWDLCTKYVPSLTEAVVDSDHVGLRPSRPRVRLELEYVKLGGKQMAVVHNYGHGGAGVTLHWGCAEDAALLVKQALDRQKHTQAKL